jgi:hypothetical protein
MSPIDVVQALLWMYFPESSSEMHRLLPGKPLCDIKYLCISKLNPFACPVTCGLEEVAKHQFISTFDDTSTIITYLNARKRFDS